MYSCRQASKLMSLKMDQQLSFVQRLTLRAHMGMCDGCRLFTKQLAVLRQVARSGSDMDETERGK